MNPGDKVRFTHELPLGGTVSWIAEVVRVTAHVASVRHPERARTMPFSPVPLKALYNYDVNKIAKAVQQ